MCPHCLVEMDEPFTVDGKTGLRCPVCGMIDISSLKDVEEVDATEGDTSG